jgi:hypothetical protein
VVLEQVISEYFGFLCQFSFHRLLNTHYLSSGAGTLDQLVADVPRGLSLTPRQEIINKKFWEELIAYFPLIQYGPHRKLNNYVDTHRQANRQQGDLIICTRNRIFIEPLPSNDKGTFTEPLPNNDRENTQTQTHTQSNVIS